MTRDIEGESLRTLRNTWQATRLSNKSSTVGARRVAVALSRVFGRVLRDCALLYRASHGRREVLAIDEWSIICESLRELQQARNNQHVVTVKLLKLFSQLDGGIAF